MLATYPQFSPQSLMGSPYGASPFGPHAGNSLGYEQGFGGLGGFGQPGQFGNPFQSQLPWQGQGQSQGLQQGQGTYALAQQLVVALGQLAHQISIQSVVSQQIGAALQHLTQQLQGQTSGMQGFGMGQLYGQPYGQQPFGAQPAWQAWGGQRPQTIQ
jgi:hypothetical protein